MKLWKHMLISVLSITGINAFTQERLKLVSADSLVSETVDHQDIWTLWGHVRLTQEEAFIECGWARWWEKEDRALLRDHVMIFDGKRTLKADQVDYRGQERIESASGHVSLESGQRLLTAEFIDYNQNQERAYAKEDVVITDLVEKVTLKGNRAEYDRQLDYSFVEGSPQLIGVDSTSKEEIVVTGFKMEAWGKEQRVLVSDSVQIQKGDLNAICQNADYRSNADLLMMTGVPILYYQKQEMRGDTIHVQFDDFRFQGGTIQGNAEIVSLDSLFKDVLKGERMTIVATDDTIRSVVVEDQASSVYHVFDEQERYQGMNSVTGDRIILTLSDGNIEKIYVESNPGQCTGTYTPEKSDTTIGSGSLEE